MNLNSSLPNALSSLKMLDDSIVEITYKEGVHVSENDIVECYEAFDLFTQNKRLKKLVIIGKDVDINSTNRAIIVKENNKRKDLVIAEAVVVNSIAQKLKTNFYIMFINKIYPIHFFTSIELAKLWLNQFE